MTDDSMALLALIQKSDDDDFLKAVAETALQRIMDYDVENQIGAARHERSADRLAYRNGYRGDCKAVWRNVRPITQG